ncbi:DUF6531 domain-containing protein [Kitasatospora griseola]|uniref:DUF6531 domain-containing protein n=1 Tax=Kitasatospora griseola TaxID=2064 RepID=UPI0036D8BF48
MSNQIVKALEHGAQKLGKTLAEDAGKALKNFYRHAGDNLKKVARNTREIEAKHAKDLEKIFKGDGKGVPHPRSGGNGRGSGGLFGRRGRGRDQVRSPHESGRQPFTICEGGEPVDMATGRMFMNQVDVELPGALPLVFTRGFESGYVAGRWMGPRWVCPFDERLEIDEEGVVHLAPDRTAQAYPHPEPGDPVFSPVGTARRELAVEVGTGVYRLTDRGEGLIREFTLLPGGEVAALTRIRDRFGRSVDFAYDADGVPLSITHSGGYRLLATVDSGRITALRLAGAGENGNDVLLVRYGYTDGHLTAVYDSAGKPARYANDASGRITAWMDRTGATRYQYTYDHLDRVVDEGSPDGLLRFRFEYGERDPQSGIAVHREIDAYGNTTTYHVNERFQITARIDPLGHTTAFERDEHDRLLAETDPLGRTTRYEYDGAGDLTAVTRADGQRSTLAYTGQLSSPAEITHPGGAQWRQLFDDHGQRTALIDPAGGVTRYTWDEHGFLTAVTDQLGRTTTLTCDAAGLPLEIIDPVGGTTRYRRDAFGRVTETTDAAGATTRFTWDTEGNLTARTLPTGGSEHFTHDLDGNLLTHTDALGQVSTFEYGPFSTLTARTAPDGSRFTFTHDANLRITAVTNALGQQWTYTHDQAGRVVAERDFHGRTTTYELDAASQLTATTNPLGLHTRYTYDQAGNTTTRAAAGRTTTFTYDAASRLLSATNPDSTLHRTVDALGNVLTETVNGRTTTCTWDAAGQRLTRTTPTGHTSTWTYDQAGRATTLTTPHGDIAFAHDTAGRELHRTIAEHLHLDSTWDDRHQLAGETLHTTGPAQPHTLNQRAYTYRADGYLTAVQDTLAGARTFDLDPIGRITAVHTATGGENYTYDRAGNITSAQWPATGATKAALGERTYTGTQLTTAGRVRYEYDQAGHVTLRQVTRLSKKPDTWRYTWDAEGRLTNVTTPDGTRWHYLYDPFGRRTAKQKLTPDGTGVEEHTDFTWDGHTLAEQTTHAPYLPGPHTLTWDHRGPQPVTQSETITTADGDGQAHTDSRFFAIITDLVGTPTELVDPATAAIAWHTTPTVWGTTTWPSDSTTYTPLRFPGQYFDPETRLHYNVYRYYDPETARYTSPDPLGLAPAPNPDTYVTNPHSLSDPLGLAAVDESDVSWGGRVTYEPVHPTLGRAQGVFAILDSSMMGGKTNPQYDPAGWVSGRGYNRAHLLGAQLGGSNKDPRNFVTMHQYANTPIMRDLEGQIRAAVDNGEIIRYRVTPVYDGNDLLPKGVTLEAHGNKGFQFQPKGSSTGTNILSICNKKKK